MIINWKNIIMKKQKIKVHFTFILTLLLLLPFGKAGMGFAQQAPAEQDPKAKAILDEVSKTTKAYKTITAEYELVSLNKEKKQINKESGKIQVKGNKFRLEIPG